MAEKHKYKEMYEKFVDYEQQLHVENQKRIRVGLKVNIILPLFFLVMSFVIQDGKLVFLILWILSLFGIAFYLMFVEYSDYKMMEQLKEFGFDTEELQLDTKLIGDGAEEAESAITERLDNVDARISEEMERLEKERRRIEKEMEQERARIEKEMKKSGKKIKKTVEKIKKNQEQEQVIDEKESALEENLKAEEEEES